MKFKLDISALMLTMYSTWFTIGIYALYLQLYAYYVVGVSNLIIGLLATVYFSVNAPASIFSGYLVDKYGAAKKLLIFSLVSLSVVSFITPLYKSGLYLLFIRFLQGLSIASIVPISNLLAAEFMGTGKGVGTINMVGSMGFASAGIIGGLLAKYIIYTNLFQLCGIITLIPTILLLSIKGDSYNLPSEHKVSLKDISRLPISIWIIYLVYSLRFIAAGGVWSLFSLFLYSLGADDFLVGLAHFLNTLTQVSLFRWAGTYSEGRGLRIFNIGILLTGIVFLGYYFSPSVYFVLPFQILLGLAWVSISAGANVYIIENSPEKYKGTALGALNMFNAISWMIGSTTNGYLSDIYRSYKTYILISVFIVILGYLIGELYYFINVKKPKN